MVEKGLITSPLQGKKMKQARLPFAPVNKPKGEPALVDAGRKRKLSEPEAIEQKKSTKLEEPDYPLPGAEYVQEDGQLSAETKSKLSGFAKKDEQKENVVKREVKPKKQKVEVIQIDEESLQERPDNMSGRVKLSFKKNKTKSKQVAKEEKDLSDIEIDDTLDTMNKDQSENIIETDLKSSEKPETADNENGRTTKTIEVDDKKETNVDMPSVEEDPTNKSVIKDDGAEHVTEQKNDNESEKKKSKKNNTSARKSKGEAKKKKENEKKEDKTQAGEKKEDEEENNSMTEDWAEFHQKEMEKNPVDGPTEQIERLVTPKGREKKARAKSKKTPESSGKQKKSPNNAKPNRTPGETTTDEKKTAVTPKSNPLAKFLVKMKPGEALQKPKVNKTDDIEIIDEVKPSEDKNNEKTEKVESDKIENDIEMTEVNTSTSKTADDPVTTSTPVNKKLEDLKTPGNKNTPETPASVRAKQLAVAKLRVQIQELSVEMEEAVKDENFLKAHELKQKISVLETETEKVQSEGPAVSSPTLNLQGESVVDTPVASKTKPKDSTSTPSASKKTPGSAGRGKNVSKVSTPGSGTEATPKAKKALTPKQLALQEERKKKIAKEKEEKEKKKQEKLAQKELEKQDKERQKEIEKRTKEIEKLEKERQRREKEREKEKERKEKEEEKLKKKAEKEAELKRKEEEKQKAEEEKLRLEEEEKEKKRKAAEVFKGFFVKKDAPKKEKEPVKENKEDDNSVMKFNPFQVKKNMRLAPLVRADTVNAKKRIDYLEDPVGPTGLYLEMLRSGRHQPQSQGKTWPWEKTTDSDSDVEVVEEEEEEEEEDPENMDEGVMILRSRVDKQPRAKLLQFHENQRPAYWGTWTKRSKFVRGRRPFGEDKEFFDYDYDSDDDWEDEGEGESLSDADDDKEEEDDYEVDNEFFVPHGYLSDGEEEKDEDEVFDPEREKEKLKLKEQEFQQECKKKTQELKPRLWGCHWEHENLDTEVASSQLIRILSGYAAITCCNNNVPIPTAVSQPQTSPTVLGTEECTESAKTKVKSKTAKNFPEEALKDLVRLVHINVNNKIFLCKEFLEFWNKKTGESSSVSEETPGTPSTQQISKRKIVDKIQEIAEYKKIDGKAGRFWVVKPNILEKVGLEGTTSNSWEYILEQPNPKPASTTSTPVAEEGTGSRPNSPVQSKQAVPNPASLITKFTKVLTEDERAKLNSTPPSKRAKLTSVTEKPNSIQEKKKPVTPVNMITVKKKPGSAAANPNLLRKTPQTNGVSSSKEAMPNLIQVRRAPRPVEGDQGLKPEAGSDECITID